MSCLFEQHPNISGEDIPELHWSSTTQSKSCPVTITAELIVESAILRTQPVKILLSVAYSRLDRVHTLLNMASHRWESGDRIDGPTAIFGLSSSGLDLINEPFRLNSRIQERVVL